MAQEMCSGPVAVYPTVGWRLRMGLGPPWAPWHGVPRCRPVPYWWLPSNQKVDLPLPRYTGRKEQAVWFYRLYAMPILMQFPNLHTTSRQASVCRDCVSRQASLRLYCAVAAPADTHRPQRKVSEGVWRIHNCRLPVKKDAGKVLTSFYPAMSCFDVHSDKQEDR